MYKIMHAKMHTHTSSFKVQGYFIRHILVWRNKTDDDWKRSKERKWDRWWECERERESLEDRRRALGHDGSIITLIKVLQKK